MVWLNTFGASINGWLALWALHDGRIGAFLISVIGFSLCAAGVAHAAVAALSSSSSEAAALPKPIEKMGQVT